MSFVIIHISRKPDCCVYAGILRAVRKIVIFWYFFIFSVNVILAQYISPLPTIRIFCTAGISYWFYGTSNILKVTMRLWPSGGRVMATS